jgi:hypothetical protein
VTRLHRLHIPGHLLIPFGTKREDGKKIKDLSHIRLTSVSTGGVYFDSSLPVLHIDKSKEEPVDFAFAERLFGQADIGSDDHANCCLWIKKKLFDVYESQGRYEKMFLELYFDDAVSRLATGKNRWEKFETDLQIYRVLLPIPEAQIYVVDPLNDPYGHYPQNNFRMDFVFWNGKRLVAVEIDGSEPEGYARDVRRDRLLRRAGIEVVHILNPELEKHGNRALQILLPRDILGAWRKAKAPAYNPVSDDIPF